MQDPLNMSSPASPSTRSDSASSFTLTELERRCLLDDWNDTKRNYPRNVCLHQLVETQAERTPEAVALVFDGKQLTFHEVNRRANQLAHRLRKLGVGPDVLVGVCMERCLEMVIGLLGILKAGGAYVPFDPEYPQERLAFMFRDAGVSVLLAQARMAGLWPNAQARIIFLDRDWPEIAEENSFNPCAQAAPHHLAYMIYTSGSTGQPKGVMNTHAGIVNRLLWMRDAYQLTGDDRVLQKTPFSFDVSVWEFFWPLITGARLVLARPGGHKDGRYLANLIQEQGITALHFVPSMLRVFLEQEGLEVACKSVRRVLCSGEALPFNLQQRFFSLLPCELHNLYGPTEAAVEVTSWACDRNSTLDFVPIGRPIANIRLYILDGEMQPVPIGVAGELHIGGVGVARGYHNRPELTAEKFVADPFSGEAGARLYKTGDLCRYRTDGNIEYLGRMDHQVKIRGFRIELGEIEAVLSEHPVIRESVVLAREGGGAEKELVAYIVVRGTAKPKVMEFRKFLAQRLPDYMIPGVYVRVERMPLTPNGKIDRKALPAPEETRMGTGEEYEAPQTLTEKALARIWGGLLRGEQIGRHDNFFALGGHSLMAVRLIFRIRDVLKVELPVRQISETPTIAELAKVVDKGGQHAAPLPPVQPAGRLPAAEAWQPQDFPVSFNQEQLWIIDQLEPGRTVYNVLLLLRLRGKLNVSALQQSLNHLVHRHEALRTRFRNDNGSPVQVVLPSLELELPVSSLAALPENERAAEVQRQITGIAGEPFDLQRGPLIRAKMICQEADHHILALTIHHVVFDGWSGDVLLRELASAYTAFSAGELPRLPELNIQYADYAVWQRRNLTPARMEDHLAYWRQELAGVPTVLELPVDRSSTAGKNSQREQRFQLSAETSATLRQLGRQNDTTLFVTMLAAFHTLLHRFSRQEQILIGTPFAGRTGTETENLIGFFVNALPVKADFSGNPAFVDLLQQVRDAVWAVQQHQNLPFELLVRELQPAREKRRNPVFQACAIHEIVPPRLDLPCGLAMELEELAPPEAMFDLMLSVMDQEEKVACALRYNAGLFEESTVAQLRDNYLCLLAGIAADVRQRVSDLPLLLDADQRRLLVEWNRTITEYPRDRCLHELFEAQARRTPEAVALVYESSQMTYRELDERAGRLAEHLRKLGVGPEKPVGLFVERSMEMVAGMLGILKAGGAYVPMDPKYPRERLGFMLEDAQMSAVLTQRRMLDPFPHHEVRKIFLDLMYEPALPKDENGSGNGSGNGSMPQANNLAYVIYTSGSTGKPKGVAIEHRNAVNFVHWGCTMFSDAQMSGVLASTSICFDLSIFEIFVTLCRGGKVILARDVLELPFLTARNQITLVNTVPSAMTELLKDGNLPPNVEVVNLAGEPLSAFLVDRIYNQGKVKQVYDLYGPTETTTYSTFAVRRPGMRSTIGRPLANTQIYILDPQMRSVPVGVPGELYIGGHGVARGYLNQPELTAERFVANPFADEPGARLYRTGDLCRYRADGNIEYLGRMDQQVKIRGFRIELGEIEAVLVGHPQVTHAAVIARDGASDGRQLVAYLVIREGTMPTVDELRALLAERLPDYMIPSVFVRLDKLPLTPNGKIDRKALPAPDENRLRAGVGLVPPRTTTEVALAKIWGELLGVAHVGVHDNFFTLGGHSLMAVRMNFRIKKELQVELPLRCIAEFPTIAQLGGKVDEAAEKVASNANLFNSDAAGSLAPQPPRKFAVTSGQEQLWFLTQLAPDSSVYNLSLVLRLRGGLNVQALEQSLNYLVRRHEALRLIFPAENGAPVAEISPEFTVSLPLVKLGDAEQSGEENELRLRMQAVVGRPFDLCRGPLVRAALFQMGPEDHALVLVVHHIVWDGWSSEILLRELAAAYKVFSAGGTPALPDVPGSYAEFARRQRRHLAGENLEAHLEFWRKELDGVPMVLDLPADKPRDAAQMGRGAEHLFRLGSRATAALRRLSQERENTLFSAVLAVFYVLLHQYSRQEQVLIGVPFAGRTSSDLESLIGFFVNALPVKGDLGANPRFEDLLRQVKAAVWSVQEHQELPFERLVRELQPVRDSNRNPVFQACLVFEVMPAEPCPMPGLQVELSRLEPPEAMFDLTLAVTDEGDELACALRYNANLFEHSTVVRMAESCQILLEAVAKNPQQRISDLPVLAELEQNRLLMEWNRTKREYPRSRCVHELFEEQADRSPSATALVSEDKELSYAELNARANRLAHHLRAVGVDARSLVGVYMDRSIEYVISVLAILKTGAAYVPLDPTHPVSRIQFLLADAGIRVLIATRPLPRDINLEGISVVDLAAMASTINSCSQLNPGPVNTTEAPAYVIFTSGSTGQPKGVVVPHRAVVRLVRGQDYARFDAQERFLLLASTSFDATTFELWGALLNGAACVLFPDEPLDFERLESVIRRHGVTCLWLTAGLFNQIVDVRPSALATVKHVLTGGEALSVPHVKKALEHLPHVELTNGYGPTESTTFACCHAIRKAEEFSRGSVPIGRPIANTRCYILDPYRRPVPVGVAGELYIGGDGLASGYLNRPALTEEKFVGDPFGDEPGARLYRTGDLCRYLRDGSIEFLGRLDQQVKLRGFRIELGEIEARLVKHPQVLNAVVAAREDVPGNKQLVAYLVAREGEAPTTAGLRTHLGKELPDYMIPAVFVNLERLPLTANGKVDRQALPAPKRHDSSDGDFVAPETPMEKKLADIWKDLLHVEQAGTRDNFFTLGGHSLLVARLAAEIKRRLHVDLPIRLVFQHPTIQELAGILQDQKSRERRPELIQLNAGRPGPELYFLIDEGSLGLFKLAPHLDREQPLYASVVPLPKAALQAAVKQDLSALPGITDWAAQHVALIRSRATNGPVLLAGHCFGGMLAFEVARQLQADGMKVAGVLLLDTWMTSPGYWWEKKAWWQAHVGNLLREGPGYLWRKSARRIRLEKKELAARIELAIFNDFNLNVPWAIIARVYREAMRRYRPVPLANRAVLLVSRDDWMANAYRRKDDTLGAGKYFTGGVEVTYVPGNHVTILDEAHLPELAEKFNQSLTAFR